MKNDKLLSMLKGGNNLYQAMVKDGITMPGEDKTKRRLVMICKYLEDCYEKG